MVVVAHDTAECAEALRRGCAIKQVLDLARLPADLRGRPGYVGLCW